MRQPLLAIAIGLALFGCSKSDGGAAPSGSAAPAAAAAAPAKTKITKAQLDEAYKKTDPDRFDQSVANATAILGKPAKSDATSAEWYGLDGTICYRLKLDKTKGNEIGGAPDDSACGK